MGNFFSYQKTPQIQQQAQIQQAQIQQIQQQTLAKFLDERAAKDAAKIRELKKQNKSLKTLNASLRNEIKEAKTLSSIFATSKNTSTSINGGPTQVSMPAIEEYVDAMLADENVNINYLPDFVEKQLYRNILKIVLGLLDHILNNSHLTVFNHEIKFDLAAASEFSPENKVDENNTIEE